MMRVAMKDFDPASMACELHASSGGSAFKESVDRHYKAGKKRSIC
jgi:hypothetical protein